MREYAVGIDIGGTHIKMGLFDAGMQLKAEQKFLTDKDATTVELFNFLYQKVESLLLGAGMSLDNVRGIGVALPSSVDIKRGVALESSNIISLNDQPVRDLLTQRFQLPVYVDNDGNVAALAEHKYGAGRGYDNLIYATLATGIGGGLILNGQLYRGMHGMAGEIGHMFISDSIGYPCGCGVIGCVQSICSGTFMARYAMDRMVASYRHHSLIDQKYPAKFLPAELGERAETIGAALLVP